jgi:hypothetical protein
LRMGENIWSRAEVLQELCEESGQITSFATKFLLVMKPLQIQHLIGRFCCW